MATLAMQKIAEISEDVKLFRKEQAVDLLFYLLRPTTTEEMRAPLKEILFDPFLAKTDHQTQRMHQMIHYCNDNFDSVDFNSHLTCIECINQQKGQHGDKSLIWDCQLIYDFLTKLVKKYYKPGRPEFDAEMQARFDGAVPAFMEKI